MKTKIFTLLTVLAISTITMAQIIHVPGDQPTIQGGIDAAQNGDIVLVDQGIYYENINFNGKAITVMSNYLNTLDSADIYNTIIDGSQPAVPGQGSVVCFKTGEDTTSVLCGFTIQNGAGTFPDIWGCHSGGGILVEFASAKVIHNIIINNAANNSSVMPMGGGISATSTNLDDMFILRNNFIADNEVRAISLEAFGGGVVIWPMNHIIIQNNTIKYNNVEGWSKGGGLYIQNCSGIITNNFIMNNNCEVSVNFGIGGGGGIDLWNPKPGLRITQNTISGNGFTGIGHFRGGGIRVLNWGLYSDYIIEGNTITNNTATWAGGINFSLEETGCIVLNNLICGNQAEEWGGGICCYNSSGDNLTQESTARGFGLSGSKGTESENHNPMFISNTICDNTAVNGGGGIANRFDLNDLYLLNNIIYNNDAAYGEDLHTAYSASTSHLNFNLIDTDLIWGNWTGENNIHADPLFEDPDNFDFNLTWANFPIQDTTQSPCIDAGDPDSLNNPDNTTADIGAFYFDQRPIIALDASEITGMSFQANWEEAEDANGYLFDVAYDEDFTNILDGYQNLDVGNVVSFIVDGLSPLTSYFYRIRANYYFGRSGYSNIINTSTLTSVHYLTGHPNVYLNIFPNPLSSYTTLSYSIPQKSQVALNVYSINGQCILQLLNKVQESGEYEIVFDRIVLSEGVYFCVLKTNDGIQTKKIIKLN